MLIVADFNRRLYSIFSIVFLFLKSIKVVAYQERPKYELRKNLYL